MLKEVRPFLRSMFSDENILPVKPAFLRRIAAWFISLAAAPASKRKYKAIGGGSPLVDISLRQAKLLEEELARRDQAREVRTAMLYIAPELSYTLTSIGTGRADNVVVVILDTIGSGMTDSVTEILLRENKKWCSDAKGFRWMLTAGGIYGEPPEYVAAFAGRVRAALEKAGEEGGSAETIFTAHSLPQKLLERDKKYPARFSEIAGLVARAAGLEKYELAYQSGRKGWLGPTVEEKLREVAGGGCRSIVVVPLSFTCDNIETLYDIDIKLKVEADRLGVKLFRAESLNDSPLFISALADVVLRHS